jgi:flagellar protein FlaG
MSNEQPGIITKEVAYDIKALMVGGAPIKATPTKTQGAANSTGNTKKTTEDLEKLKKAVKESADYFERFAKDNQFNLKFSVDDKSDSIVVQVVEIGTGKLIRQIPSEEVLRLRQRISDLLGMIYDREM